MEKTKTKRKTRKTVRVTYNPIDVHIGQRLKKIRWVAGMTQKELAKRIGVTFQQIQKYEQGANRMSLSRAVKICEVLEITINGLMGEHAMKEESPFMEMLNSREALMLGRRFMKLSETKRKKAVDFIKLLE